jgi:hypothetical protein
MRSAWMLLLVSIVGCEGAEVIAESPLLVLDTYPSNGAHIAAGETQLAVVWSEPIAEPGDWTGWVSLEEINGAGAPVRVIPLTIVDYTEENATAVWSMEPLPAGADFSLTIDRDKAVAASGAIMPATLVRRFRTGE